MQDLRTVREQRRLTQIDVSELTGLPQSHIQGLEAGKFVPREVTRQRLERILGDVDWLASASGDKGHITRKLVELINLEADNVLERIAHVRRILHEIEKIVQKD